MSKTTKLSPFACDRAPGVVKTEEHSGSRTETIVPVSGRKWLCLFERFSRMTLRSSLARLERGQVVLEHSGKSERFGSLEQTELSGHVQVHSPKFYRRLITGGALGAAESYLDGEWESEELTDLFRVLLQNEHVLQRFQSPLSLFSRIGNQIRHLRNRNSKAGSRRNIHEHYDLGNSFFSLFLDPTMMYSSGIFPEEQTTLQEASMEKVDRVCRQLRLCPDDDVIEIGSGWGTFAIHAASKYGCRVTTTTISEEQFRMATQRVEEAGLAERVTVLKRDYRDLDGRFDKLVSIEMIEAVGKKYLPQYFATCDRLLNDRGAMMIQAITMPEQRYESYKNSVDFIQKYIFPGGFLPSISEMQRCVAKATTLRMVKLDDFGLHYARTLRLWNERFHDQLDNVRRLGFGDRFIRMWRYYLCYCEAAFLERAIGVVQVMWAKPGSPLGTPGTGISL